MIFQQLLDPFAPLRSHNAELRHVRPQGIDHLGPLTDEKVSRAMQHQARLLLDRLDLHEPHGRRRTASQIASASAASFLLRLT